MKDLPKITPTIALRHALPVLNELELRGYSRAQLFSELDITLPAEMEINGALLSATNFTRLYGHSYRLLEALTSGRQDNSGVSKNARDMMCYCIISCRTLKEAIERAVIYCGLLNSKWEMLRLEESGDTAALIVEIRQPQRDNASLLVCLSTLNMLHQLFSWLIGRILRLRTVAISYPEPQAPVIPGTLVGQPLSWRAGCDAIVFPAHFLALPVVRTATELEHVIDYFSFDMRYCSGQHLQTLAGRLRALLINALQKGLPPMHSATAAQMLHMSASTLRCNLRKEGSSFTAILRDCQHTHALYLLQRTDAPIAEIAARIGYSDDRAFRRAFRNWTGQSPSSCRTQAQIAGGPTPYNSRST